MSRSPRSPDQASAGAERQTLAFWQFAEAAWEQSATRDRLLQWQERHDADVILILFACWWPVALGARQWLALRDAVGPWHTVVTQRIRHLRRQIRNVEAPELYRHLLRLELRAEQIQASWLCRAVSLRRVNGTDAADPERRIARLYPAIPPPERTALIKALPPRRGASSARSATQP